MMKRFIYLDIIRILACLMIIAMHAPIPNTGLSSYLLSSDSLLTAPGIGLFIMVSGALLLPVNMSTEQFLKRRFNKIVAPTVLWTVFYYLVAPYTETVDRGASVVSFMSILFSPQFNSVLWFMYMLAGLYLLAPILSVWLSKATRREIELYLGLWCITICYPLIRNIVRVDETHMGILYYFGGYAGYFLLGYYLHNYVNHISVWKCLLFLLIPLGIATMFKIQGIQVRFYDMFWYLSIFIVMMCVSWFLLIKKMEVVYNSAFKWHRYIELLSNCCFGIYLIHIFIMRSLLWNWTVIRELDGIVQIGAVTFLSFVGSLIITWLISYLPWSEYIIGIKTVKLQK